VLEGKVGQVKQFGMYIQGQMPQHALRMFLFHIMASSYGAECNSLFIFYFFYAAKVTIRARMDVSL
jgi:hypothetical protein